MRICILLLALAGAGAVWVYFRGAQYSTPALGEPYPDLTGVDQDGKPFQLSSHRGSVILVELIGMSCSACVAFCGGHDRGMFEGVSPQTDLPSLDDLYIGCAGGDSLAQSDVVYVQVLCFNMNMEAPDADDVKRWAEHFQVERANDHYVITGSPQLFGSSTAAMIPGFHLIDSEFELASDSCGHNPRQSLHKKLLPMIPELIDP